jgi:hypothetical protein
MSAVFAFARLRTSAHVLPEIGFGPLDSGVALTGTVEGATRSVFVKRMRLDEMSCYHVAQLNGSLARWVSACQKTVPEYLAPSSRESPAELVFMGLVATFQWQIVRLSNCLGNDPKRL